MEKPLMRYFLRGRMIYHLTSEDCREFFQKNPHITPYEFLCECKTMQSIGMVDRSGRLIYTGDIIKITKKDQILFGNRFVVNWNWEIYRFEPFNIYARSGQDYEVMGNVYENPEIKVFNRVQVEI